MMMMNDEDEDHFRHFAYRRHRYITVINFVRSNLDIVVYCFLPIKIKRPYSYFQKSLPFFEFFGINSDMFRADGTSRREMLQHCKAAPVALLRHSCRTREKCVVEPACVPPAVDRRANPRARAGRE